MALDEWEKTLKSIGSAPFWITISGGEPFLSKDLEAFCKMVYRYCSPALINIPTNGILDSIPGKVEKIAEACKDIPLIINLSLDGVGVTHDQIRRVPGNFEKFERTLFRLLDLRKRLPNVQIGIHSVVSTYNVNNLDEIFAYANKVKPDQFITEMAEERVELGTIDLPISPEKKQYEQVLSRIISDLERQTCEKVSRFTIAFRIEYYRMVKSILEEKRQIIPCYAGWASGQIFADGTVWPCCVRGDPLGNLRDVGYDFPKIWFGKTSANVRGSIAKRECFCPLANASYTNMLMHIPTLLRVGLRIANMYARSFSKSR